MQRRISSKFLITRQRQLSFNTFLIEDEKKKDSSESMGSSDSIDFSESPPSSSSSLSRLPHTSHDSFQRMAEKPSSVKARSALLYNTGHLTDVTFVVGDSKKKKTFKAHKLILAASSEVFETMFFGALPETNGTISISDADPEAFEKMLRYLYLDDTNFETPELALLTLSLAHKYMLTHLQELCSLNAIKSINANNACKILENACLYDLSRIKKMAMYYICKNTDKVLSSDAFLDAQLKIVEKILSQDHLNITETNIIASLSKWATRECIRHHKSQNWKEIRNVLLPLLPYLRLTTLSSNEFLSVPLENKILNETESLSLLVNIVKPGSKSLPAWCCKNDKKRVALPAFQSATLSGNTAQPHSNHNVYGHQRPSSSDYPVNPLVIECKFTVNEGNVIIDSLIFRDQQILSRLNSRNNAYDYEYDYHYGYGFNSPRRNNERVPSFSATLFIHNVLEDFTVSWPTNLDPDYNNKLQISLSNPLVICEGEVYEFYVRLEREKSPNNSRKSPNSSENSTTYTERSGPFSFHKQAGNTSVPKLYFHELKFVSVSFASGAVVKTGNKTVIRI